MDFIHFPEANTARTAPEGLGATVGTLPAYNDGQVSISCWQPTQQEREAIAAGLPVWLGCLSVQPAVWVSAVKPDMPPVVHEPSEQYLASLEHISQMLPAPADIAHGLRPARELLAQYPDLRDREGLLLNGEGLAYLVDPASQLEHYAALVEAYRQQGRPGVVAYLQPYAEFIAFHQPK